MFYKKLIFSIVLFIISGVGYMQSRDFPYPTNVYTDTLLILTAILACLHLYVCFTKHRHEVQDGSKLSASAKTRLAAGMVAAVLYGVLLPIVGFYTTSVVYFVSIVHFFNPEKTKKSLAIAIGSGLFGAVLLYGLFDILLRVPTPKGFLI